jgi:hypothetical protein
MGPVNWLAVVLGALAFFAVGAVWYSFLFSKAWQREAGVTGGQGASLPKLLVCTFLLELIVATMFGHLLARTGPSPHVIMMMALGFGLTIMTPAIGINYLYQGKSLKLFLIDAGHFVVGMAALGAVFVLLS